MDLRLLVGLSGLAALVAAGVAIACLIRIEDLHRDLLSGRPPGRRKPGSLRGRGKILPLHGSPPPRR